MNLSDLVDEPNTYSVLVCLTDLEKSDHFKLAIEELKKNIYDIYFLISYSNDLDWKKNITWIDTYFNDLKHKVLLVYDINIVLQNMSFDFFIFPQTYRVQLQQPTTTTTTTTIKKPNIIIYFGKESLFSNWLNWKQFLIKYN